MKTVLNLIDVNKSSINWKIDYFPDGQINFRFIDFAFKHNIDEMILRIKSSNDLFMVMQIKDIIDRAEIKIKKITISYLLGARQDRVFDLSQPYTLKLVAEIINSFGASVEIVDPHSERALNLIKNSTIAKFPFFNEKRIETSGEFNLQKCFPDAGALQRNTCNTTNKLEIKSLWKPLVCEKKRNSDNTLSGFEIKNPDDYRADTAIIVIDDLCDGGGTFCGIVKELRKLNPPAIYLYVTHAIQLEGIKKVASVYDKVIITNSYADWDLSTDLPENVYVFKAI